MKPERLREGGGGLGRKETVVSPDEYVEFNFAVLIAGLAIVGYVLWRAFFRHDVPGRRGAGYVVVFVGFVLVIMLINKAVF